MANTEVIDVQDEDKNALLICCGHFVPNSGKGRKMFGHTIAVHSRAQRLPFLNSASKDPNNPIIPRIPFAMYHHEVF